MRCKDRLVELKQQLAEGNGVSGGVYHDTVEVLVHDPDHAKQENEEINAIFDEVDKMRGWIYDLRTNTQVIRSIYTNHAFHTNKILQDQLDSVITQSNAIGLKLCGALRQFETRTKSGKFNDVKGRISRLQYAVTRQLYSEALMEHQTLLQTIRDGQYDLLQEQIRLTNLSITDDECQNLLETNNISLFVHNIEAETHEARLALREVESRHQELLRIEESVKEVRDLFMQMAQLVAQQQELVDTVEYYASQATELVECGGQELMKGSVSKRKSRNKKIGLIVCLVSGFLIVLFVLIVT